MAVNPLADGQGKFKKTLRVLPGGEAAQATAAEQVPKDDVGDLRLRSWFFLGGSRGVPEFIK